MLQSEYVSFTVLSPSYINLHVSRLRDPLFITALKTLMTILHKTQSLVHGVLSGEFSFRISVDATEAVVTWPVEQRDWSIESRVEWITGLLKRVNEICENLLISG